jgi:hypothetical protein
MAHRSSPLAALLLLMLPLPPARADAELLLEGGKTLTGRSVERKGSVFLLEVDEGQVVTVPVELVRQLRLTGEDAPPATGLKPGEPETLAGRPDAERLPTVSEQRAVLLDSESTFRSGVVDPYWFPTDDWEPSVFRPARWFESPIDPNWRPRSDYNAHTDATEFNPARWYVAPIDPIWWPQDGFRPPLAP